MHYGHSPGFSVVEFAIDLENFSGGFGKRTNMVDDNQEVTSEYYTEGTMWTVSEHTKSYTESKYGEESRRGTPLKIEKMLKDIPHLSGLKKAELAA